MTRQGDERMTGEETGRFGQTPSDVSMMAEGLKRSSERMDVTKSPIYEEVMAYIGDERTVLDIGAGVGRFTGPLAKAGCHVTAIEPSDEMLPHLQETVTKQGIADRVTLIHGAWPLDEPIHAEIALAAYVIQFSNSIAEFALAMKRAATRRCILAVHVDPLMGFMEPLWTMFRPNEPAPHMLNFADIYPQLLAADVVADVRIFSESLGPRWSNPMDAVPMIARRLGILDNPASMERLKEVLRDRQEQFTQPRDHRAAVISFASHP
jgi:FkbM family methyltransferase